MGYQLSVQEKKGYLHFRVTGENNVETVQNYLAEILALCVEQNASSVLIEEDLTGSGLNIIDIFRIADEGSREARSQIRRCAYVDKNVDHSQVDMGFAATVASNRGLNVRIFTTVSEAELWLQSVYSSPS